MAASVLRPRVLVVDDDPRLIRVLSMYLAVEGYEVTAATDGEEALRSIELMSPDLVILDVMMAGLDGIATCRRIKRDPRWRHIPVVMFTALERDADELAGRAAGADRYLAKPFSLVGLGAVVRSHLEPRLTPV